MSSSSQRSEVIAIAGAKGGVGQHIAEALLAGGFRILLLLRKDVPELIEQLRPFIPASPSQATDALSHEVVDFGERAHLTTVLKQHQVDTVISALALVGPGEWTVEENLLHAAITAGARRFAPSNFAGPVDKSQVKRAYEFKRKMLEIMPNAGISWTHFTNGIFMNYFASGAPVAAGGGNPSGHLRPIKFIMNIENLTATIPGTGDEPVAFTEVRDVAQGVMAACSLDAPWTPTTGWMAGEITSYNHVLSIAERVRGQKFDVKRISDTGLADLCTSKTEAPGMISLFEVMRLISQGSMAGPNHLQAALEAESKGDLFKPVGVDDFVTKWWASGPS